MRVQYLRGLSSLRDDPGWMGKVLVGAILSLVPFLGPLVLLGWAAVAMRRMAKGPLSPLPRLDFDLAYLIDLLEPGFKAFVPAIVWMLPGQLLFGCLYASAVLAGAGLADTDAQGLGVVCAACGASFALFFIVVSAFLAQIATIRAALAGSIMAGLDARAVIDTAKRIPIELVVGNFVVGFVSVLLGLAGMLACCVGVFFVVVVRVVMRAHLGVQLYERAVSLGAPAVEIAPDALPQAPVAPAG